MKLLIFTYAPAGLGHLRVTDALADSRPANFSYIMLGSYDKFITSFHRFFSTNMVAKWIFTISQYGIFEDIFTSIYTRVLILTSEKIFEQLKEIINEKKEVTEIWIVATHFGMAHQIGHIKERLIKETGKKIRLIVQVTDDTTQHIWCTKGSDLTFVPSLKTKNVMENYAKKRNMNIKFEVIPYPISPTLTAKSPNINKRSEDLLSKDTTINIAVPISGAAVGLNYFSKLISSVTKQTDRVKFFVLVKKSVYTDIFLSVLSKNENVKLIVGRNDNEMVGLYEKLYENNLIHIEITKPSEQAFKALIPPTSIGGSIILFTSPVGRQEYENIDFLVRHGLVTRSKYEEVFPDITKANVYPRGISISKDPELAASFILWGLETGLFSRMSSSKFNFSENARSSGEVSTEGTKIFWKTLQKHFG